MMSTQREALRLADAIDPLTRKELDNLACAAAAVELRRQYAEIQEWRAKAATWLASPEAAQRLEGYRELGQRAERAEAKCDAMRAELREATEAVDDPAVNNLRTLPESIRMLRAERDALLEALQRYVHHFGDPLKCARAAIAKATGGTPCAC